MDRPAEKKPDQKLALAVILLAAGILWSMVLSSEAARAAGVLVIGSLVFAILAGTDRDVSTGNRRVAWAIVGLVTVLIVMAVLM